RPWEPAQAPWRQACEHRFFCTSRALPRATAFVTLARLPGDAAMLKTQPSDYNIQAVPREGLSMLLDWAHAEGWNPGLHDALAYHATDPGGFLVARVADRPV